MGNKEIQVETKLEETLQIVPQCDNNNDPPEFSKPITDISAVIGTRTRFIVQVTSSSKPKVTWFHNDETFEDNEHLVQHQEGNFYSVEILEITQAEEGKWTCRAENDFGGISCSALLKVTVPPVYRAPEFVKQLQGCLWDNGTLSLECEVTGTPTPMLRWYKDGTEIKAGNALTLKANSKDTQCYLGLYSCEAVNCMGSKSIFSKVYVVNFWQFLANLAKCTKTAQSTPKIN